MKLLQGKIVVLGTHGVGKSSMVVRYVGNMFSTQISPTIGATFFTCKVNIGDTTVKLQVWDTAGQERFRSMAPIYYRNANGALLVFDITDYNSFLSVKNWIKELHTNVKDPLVLILVGNKMDLESNRQVQTSEAMQYAHSIGAEYSECSALQDQGIEQVFLNTATGLMKMAGVSIASSFNNFDPNKSFETLVPSVECTTLTATNVGKTEHPPWSIDSIAHADSEKPYMCC